MQDNQIVRLGQVRATRDHDYLQFFFALIAVLAVLCGLGWAWQVTTHVHYITAAIGPYFSAAFAVLLAYGLVLGLVQSWKISRAINSIKRCQSVDDLQQFFGFEPNSKVSTDYLHDVVADDLESRIDSVNYIKWLAVMTGLFGTVLGLMQVFDSLDIHSADDVFKAMPMIKTNIKVAFGTTLVGIIVSVIVGQMGRIVRGAAKMLKARILRVLQQS